jgi:hypothetical protein
VGVVSCVPRSFDVAGRSFLHCARQATAVFITTKLREKTKMHKTSASIHDWLLATGYWLEASGYWLLAIGHWLLATGYWLQATGY